MNSIPWLNDSVELHKNSNSLVFILFFQVSMPSMKINGVQKYPHKTQLLVVYLKLGYVTSHCLLDPRAELTAPKHFNTHISLTSVQEKKAHRLQQDATMRPCICTAQIDLQLAYK